MARRLWITTISITIILLVVAGARLRSRGNAFAMTSPDRVVVHEWGTFTSVIDSSGTPQTWQPLLGTSDLPDFVYGLGGHIGSRNNPQYKRGFSGTVRMETPVIYLYSTRETKASVHVSFPGGIVTEWYPQGVNSGQGIGWNNVQVAPDSAQRYSTDSTRPDSRYYRARTTDASPLVADGRDGHELEKFLFYRGVGSFDLPLSVRPEGQKVLVKSNGPADPSRVILFENTAGKVRYQIEDLADGQATFDRSAAGHTVESLRADLKNMLVAAGLYPKEADAMIATWDDTWFEEGLRALYVLPRSVTDFVLPITVDPQPKELERVMVVRAEIITPEMEAAVREQVNNLASDSAEVRNAAAQALRQRGRFLQPVIQRIMQGQTDSKVEQRLGEFLESLQK
ncbi:MAG TPA: hypothetical protein VEZ90_18670 [Blastocatellia bacterium]|nr:hypothetical protein [Blastocatellia bacterium]